MMGGYGFGILGCVFGLLVIGVVVYFATTLALKSYNKKQT